MPEKFALMKHKYMLHSTNAKLYCRKTSKPLAFSHSQTCTN